MISQVSRSHLTTTLQSQHLHRLVVCILWENGLMTPPMVDATLSPPVTPLTQTTQVLMPTSSQTEHYCVMANEFV
jgi:hypothetical protein